MTDVPEGGQPPHQPPGAPAPYPQPYPPPGQPGWEAPPNAYAVPRLSSTRALAIIATVAVAFAVVMFAVRGLLAPTVAHDIDLEIAGTRPDSVTTLLVFSGVAIACSALLLVAGVLTIVWLNLVRTNAERLSPKVGHARSQVWVTLGWIAPFVSLWFPLQVVRDVRRALSTDLQVRQMPASAGVLVGFWWFFFLVMDVLSGLDTQILALSGPLTSSDSDALRYLTPSIALFATAAGILWILIIVSTERMQAQRAAQELGP